MKSAEKDNKNSCRSDTKLADFSCVKNCKVCKNRIKSEKELDMVIFQPNSSMISILPA